MPYNIFYIAFFAIALGIAVALLTRFGKPAEKQPVLPEAAFEARTEHAFARPVGAEELRGLARGLLGRYGIEVEGETSVSEGDFYLLGQSADPVVGGRYVVHCHVGGEDEVLPPESILEFRDFVRAQGMTRGIYLTTGYFAKESRFLVEDAPVSLLSRGDVKQLLEAA
jgi:hypothetical protein